MRILLGVNLMGLNFKLLSYIECKKFDEQRNEAHFGMLALLFFLFIEENNHCNLNWNVNWFCEACIGQNPCYPLINDFVLITIYS